MIVAVSPKDDDDVEVVDDDTVMYAGDTAIVVADNEVLDDVRALFKGCRAFPTAAARARALRGAPCWLALCAPLLRVHHLLRP